MDIFAHGLWAGADAKAAKKESKKPIKVWLTVFWGVIPDLFAFVPAFIYLFYQALIVGQGFAILRPHADIESETVQHQVPLFDLSTALYNYSHSLVIFALVALLVWLLRKKVPWEMLGWPLHILIDIPTHSYKFFPTPFLWPVSNLEVNGFSWGTPWFMILNYGSLLALYVVLSRREFKDSLRIVLGVLSLILIASFVFTRS